MSALSLRLSFFFPLLLFTLPLHCQRVCLKSDLFLWATTTPNGSLEFSVSRRLTFEAGGAYNAWKFGNGMKLNLYLARPEFRYWFCQRFEGHFLGIHGHYGHFNVGQIPFLSGMKDRIYRGDFYGGGISYGYHWAFGERWGLEAVIGGGYARLDYDKYRCVECAERTGSYRRHYFGPTRTSLSLIYFIR
ncbi:DUF3575 domain-containing protein [Bacteroides fragilis]|uniref:DUF3575 domain-containing protein n=1 Tax=Bacteroides fragilis TaxID=817 RepID=UPI00202DEEAE|nr:DUF3575 domain-containing protein [Bacteroides fragilis]MCM0239113.1 DUF3575 domain-containing protein [Bacteroides fragilis]